ncbi:MAG: recombination mediator RecR [Coprobacillus sp.]|nr:recombination mediator RecR [Coprobacillus sp.]
MDNLKSIERATDSLSTLPSIGRKSAERIAYSLLDLGEDSFNELIESITALRKEIHECPICGNLIDDEGCPICGDEERDRKVLMVVSYPKDILSFEKSKQYHGVYQVIKGVINPVKGEEIAPEVIKHLITRIKEEKIEEVIFATSPTVEGELTASYLASKLKEEVDIKISRLAYGLQMGGNLDYVDALTLGKALEGRTNIKG